MPLEIKPEFRMTTFAELNEGEVFFHDIADRRTLSVKGQDGRDFAILLGSVEGPSEWPFPWIDRPEDHTPVLCVEGRLEIEPLPEGDGSLALPTRKRGTFGATPNGALVIDSEGEAWVAITFNGTLHYNLRLGREGTPAAGRMIFSRWRVVRRGTQPDRDVTVAVLEATTRRA